MKKGFEASTVKVTVTEIGASDTKATVRIEAPADILEDAKACVLENISNVYSK